MVGSGYNVRIRRTLARRKSHEDTQRRTCQTALSWHALFDNISLPPLPTPTHITAPLVIIAIMPASITQGRYLAAHQPQYSRLELPWSSANCCGGKPDRRCSPSQFWLISPSVYLGITASIIAAPNGYARRLPCALQRHERHVRGGRDCLQCRRRLGPTCILGAPFFVRPCSRGGIAAPLARRHARHAVQARAEIWDTCGAICLHGYPLGLERRDEGA